MNFEFKSNRSVVYGRKAMAASSQPFASATGVEILRRGGNAASAAIAMAAVLNVTEPTSTGIGGDVFVLYYSADHKKVYSLNGSGRAPFALSLKRLRGEGFSEIPPYHPYTVTVPGACDAWFTLNKKFGNLPMDELLAPAIQLAENGFPVSPITSYFWAAGAKSQLGRALNGNQMLTNGIAPKAGQIFKNPGLAKTFSIIADKGCDAFYQGEIAEAIVNIIQQAGGCLSLNDLRSHHSDWVEPISIVYENARIWECPPNGQGLAALIGLNILRHHRDQIENSSNALRLHLQIESMRLAFADAFAYISDPEFNKIPVDWLLSEEYGQKRARLIDPRKRISQIQHGTPIASSDTVYFCTVDQQGNACSFINSNYMGFGTGIVPDGYGFTLQNRGHNFSLDENHPNCLEPGKRPYHTIIPALATHPQSNDLIGPFGVMGGFMQPQGHLQVACKLFLDKLDPQSSLDKPRFCIQSDETVALEEGVPDKEIQVLAELGHPVKKITGFERAIFGRGQIILKDDSETLCAGSDPRADGCAMVLI